MTKYQPPTGRRKKVQKLSPGDIVVIPANVKHWHGAHSWFSHIAVEVPEEETENVWLEQVANEEYNKLSDEKN